MGSFLMDSLQQVLAKLRDRAKTLETTEPKSSKKGLSYQCATYPCRNYPLTSARMIIPETATACLSLLKVRVSRQSSARLFPKFCYRVSSSCVCVGGSGMTLACPHITQPALAGWHLRLRESPWLHPHLRALGFEQSTCDKQEKG